MVCGVKLKTYLFIVWGFIEKIEWVLCDDWQDSAGDLSSLWRQAANFHLRGGEPAVAAKSLEELLRVNPADTKTLAQLIIAYAQVTYLP